MKNALILVSIAAGLLALQGRVVAAAAPGATVDTDERTVTLMGEVGTPEQRTTAGPVARPAEGVEGVRNALELRKAKR